MTDLRTAAPYLLIGLVLLGVAVWQFMRKQPS